MRQRDVFREAVLRPGTRGREVNIARADLGVHAGVAGTGEIVGSDNGKRHGAASAWIHGQRGVVEVVTQHSHITLLKDVQGVGVEAEQAWSLSDMNGVALSSISLSLVHVGNLCASRAGRRCLHVRHRSKWILGSLGLLSALLIVTPLCLSQPAPLVPLRLLFGNPSRDQPQLSPDGTRLAYLAPGEKGLMQVFIQTLGKNDAQQETHNLQRAVEFYRWAADSQHILYEQDSAGDENYHIFSLDLASRQIRDLTPFLGVRAQNLMTSPRRPSQILVALNLRNSQSFDMYRIDVNTGAVVLDTVNPGDVMSWTVDPEFEIRAATAFDQTTLKTVVRVRDDKHSAWRSLTEFSFEESRQNGQLQGGTIIVGFSSSAKTLYIVSPRDSDKTRLVELDSKTGKQLRTIAEQECCDVADDHFGAFLVDPHSLVMFDDVRHVPDAIGFEYSKFFWQFVDADVKARLRHYREKRRWLLPRGQQGWSGFKMDLGTVT